MVIKTVKKKARRFAGNTLPSVNEMASNAEMMLMGYTVPLVTSDGFNRNETIWYTSYILSVLKGNTPADNASVAHSIFDDIQEYHENIIRHMSVSRLFQNMVVINFTLDTLEDDEEEYPEDLATPDGVFSYVYNTSCPDCSEFGYTFYEKTSCGLYHRVS